ncbi:MAG: hypothetical protein A2138_08945 [Deltaproteobacteria bacterium RBG_16_71_12]|nr:MAG: hypothetical protein A2138_08945 [Deltaproteobacteria bacterium RBG_16_71_12]
MPAPALPIAVLLIAAAGGPRHFEDITGDLPGEAVTAVAVDPDDDQLLYAGVDGFLLRSTDGGESWRPVLSFPRGFALDDADAETRARALDADPTDAPDEVAGRGARATGDLDDEVERDRVLTDEEERRADDDELAIEPLPEGSLDFESPELVDAVDLVVPSRTEPGVRAIAFVPRSPGMLWVATPRGLYRSTTRGESFERVVVPGGAAENDVRDVAVDPRRPSRLYLATAAGLRVTRDGGASFTTAPGRVGAVPGLCVVAAEGKADLALLVGTTHGLFRSLDEGATFLEVLLRGMPPRTPVLALGFQAVTDTAFAGTVAGLFVGERRAALLERYGGVPAGVQAIAAHPTVPRALAAGTHARGVALSYDAGLTVLSVEQVPAREVLSLARGSDPDALVVATDVGVFRSVPGSGVSLSASALVELRKLWQREPSIEATMRMALDWGGLAPDEPASMRARAGLAALLPRLDVRYYVVSGRTERVRQFVLRAADDLPPGFDPGNDDIDLFGNVGFFIVEPAVGTKHRGLLTLTWDLDRLVFNPDQVGVGRSFPTWHAAERRVIDAVQETYAARRRLMTEIAAEAHTRKAGQLAAVDAARRELRKQELTALLDAATGGGFSASEQRQGHDGPSRLEETP